MNFKFLWPDFDPESESSKQLREIKSRNDENYWSDMREVLKHDTETLPLSRFRMWQSLWSIPLIQNYKTARFIGEALYWAYQDDDYYQALKENWIGLPEDYKAPFLIANDLDTSMQRVQDLSHLTTGLFKPNQIKNFNSVIEIGAGYGNMCSLIHALGFEGRYTIVDIPEMIPVQNYYLNRQDIYPEYSFEDDNVSSADLVIATWSLSETPVEYRDKLLDKIGDSKNWLIVSQKEVFGRDDVNFPYFDKFFEDKNVRKKILKSEGLDMWDGSNVYYIVNEGEK